MQPLDVWLGGHTELVVGVEQEFESVRSAVSRSYARVRQFQQWAIVAAKGHAMMRRIADRVVEAVTAEQQRQLATSSASCSTPDTVRSMRREAFSGGVRPPIFLLSMLRDAATWPRVAGLWRT